MEHSPTGSIGTAWERTPWACSAEGRRRRRWGRRTVKASSQAKIEVQEGSWSIWHFGSSRLCDWIDPRHPTWHGKTTLVEEAQTAISGQRQDPPNGASGRWSPLRRDSGVGSHRPTVQHGGRKDRPRSRPENQRARQLGDTKLGRFQAHRRGAGGHRRRQAMMRLGRRTRV